MRRMSLTLAVLAVPLLAGCEVSTEKGSLTQQLGLVAGSPDEFLIIAHKPIEMPPSMNLPRPQPGAPSRVAPTPLADAHQSLFNRPEPVRLANASTGEQVLLSGADAGGDNSVIREVISGEDPEADGERRYGLTYLFGVRIPNDLRSLEDGVDPQEETAELRRRGYLTPTAPPPVEDEDE